MNCLSVPASRSLPVLADLLLRGVGASLVLTWLADAPSGGPIRIRVQRLGAT